VAAPLNPTWRVELAWRRWFLDEVEKIAREAAAPREVIYAGVCIAIYPPISDEKFTEQMEQLLKLWEQGEYNHKYNIFLSDLTDEEVKLHLEAEIERFGAYAVVEREGDPEAQGAIAEYELHWARWLMVEARSGLRWTEQYPAAEYLDNFLQKRREVKERLDAVRDRSAEEIIAALRNVERQSGAKPISELEKYYG